MTTAQIVRDAAVYQSLAPSHRPLRPVSHDAKIARMDALELDGQYDKTADGLRRSRQGVVGDAVMTCQVATLGGDVLILFWALSGDGHQRRFLVDGQGAVYMDTGNGRAVVIGSNNKYFAPCQAVLAARAN